MRIASEKGAARIRTGDKGFADLCLTTWLRRRRTGRVDDSWAFRKRDRPGRVDFDSNLMARRRQGPSDGLRP